jgi:hypothetical protein
MKPMLKRAAAVVAAKKAVDVYRASRRPQRPSLLARAVVPATLLGVGGAVAYLGVTGKLHRVTDQIKRLSGSDQGPPTSSATAPTQDGPVGAPIT